jgi:hypothetical protein
MSGSQTGWSWFERGAHGGSERSSTQDEVAAERIDPDRALRVAYARCFATPEGEKVLKHLRAVTLERVLGPDASASMLRHLEGQRQLVSSMAAWAERGRTGT